VGASAAAACPGTPIGWGVHALWAGVVDNHHSAELLAAWIAKEELRA
jgi:hypothetical protein